MHVSSVLDYLRGRGVAFLVLPDPDASSVEDTAERHEVARDEMVRTVVMTNRFGHALMVVPWTRQLDVPLGAPGDERSERRADTRAGTSGDDARVRARALAARWGCTC